MQEAPQPWHGAAGVGYASTTAAPGGGGYGTPAEKMVGTLGAGSFFGEVAITKPEGAQRNATCVARTLLMLDKLTRHALDQVADVFPTMLASVRKIAIERRRLVVELSFFALSLFFSSSPNLIMAIFSASRKKSGLASSTFSTGQGHAASLTGGGARG